MLYSPYFWLSLGLICLIIEILTPGFIFAAFAMASFLTGICAFWVKNFYILSAVFAFSGLIVYFALKPWYFNCVLKEFAPKQKFGFQALMGKTGIITQNIEENKAGYIKIDGDIWLAHSKKNIEIGEKAIIYKLEGNGVWVDEI